MQEKKEKTNKKEQIHHVGYEICTKQSGDCKGEHPQEVPGGQAPPGGWGHRAG